jgi:hypothetical protein
MGRTLTREANQRVQVMHPSQWESLTKQRQDEFQRAARASDRSRANVSRRRPRHPLRRVRHAGMVLIRIGEWIVGPEAPSARLRPGLVELPFGSSQAD